MAVMLKVKDKLLDLFFPQVRCMVCDSAENVEGGLCAACCDEMERYPLLEVHRAEQTAYTAAKAVYVYEGVVRKVIHCMKFAGQYDLPVRLFAQEMSGVLGEVGWRVDCVVAVPTEAKSLRKRGYNQAEKLAKRLCRLRGLRMETRVIKKKRGTRSQVGLNAQERRRNLTGALLPDKRSKSVMDKCVLLIDDVYTTGATAEICALTLLACGAKEVYVLCAARVADHALEQYLAGKME